MTEPQKPVKTLKPKTPPKSELAAKRAENLRQNLMKRKEQARSRQDGQHEPQIEN
jgi:hypothetical protein